LRESKPKGLNRIFEFSNLLDYIVKETLRLVITDNLSLQHRSRVSVEFIYYCFKSLSIEVVDAVIFQRWNA